jgi:hypothetical protein
LFNVAEREKGRTAADEYFKVADSVLKGFKFFTGDHSVSILFGGSMLVATRRGARSLRQDDTAKSTPPQAISYSDFFQRSNGFLLDQGREAAAPAVAITRASVLTAADYWAQQNPA